MSLRDVFTIAELRARVGVEPIRHVCKRNRLIWLEHVERKGNADWMKTHTRMEVESNVDPEVDQGKRGRKR
jgi:hypothetical protein